MHHPASTSFIWHHQCAYVPENNKYMYVRIDNIELRNNFIFHE